MIIDSVSLKRHEEPKALKLEIATHEGLQDTKPHPKLLQSGPCCFSAQSWALVYGVVFWLGFFILFIGVLADLWYLWMIGGVMMLLAWLPNIIDVFFAKVSESVDRKTVAVRNKDSVAKLVGVAPKLYHKVVCSHSAAPGVGSGGRRESTFGFGETRVVTHKEWVPFEVYPEWVTTLISDYDFDKSKEFSMLQFDTSLVFADEDSVHWMQETAKSIQMQYREKDDQLDYALVMDPTFPTDVMLKDGEAEPPEWLHPNCYKCLGFAALNCCLIRVVDAMSEHLRLNVQKKISFYANDPNYQQDQAAAAAAAAAYDGAQQEYAAGQEIEVGQEQYADYDQQAYAGQEYDQQAYAEQEYAGQEYNEQAYDGQEYDQQAYDQQGYDQQAYDGQEYAAGEYAEAQSQSQPSAE